MLEKNGIKIKHHKKRNTSFLYEALSRELTKYILKKDEMRKAIIISVLREHFYKDSVLNKELAIFRSLYETVGMSVKTAEKILQEAKKEYDKLDKELIFIEQTKLIGKINRKLTQNVFSNFIPDYKNLATISQIFNRTLPIKERILLEQNVLHRMCAKIEEKKDNDFKPIDNIVYRTLIKKFNEKYVSGLLEEQKNLLSHYVMSFSDNGLSLKLFLNEEIERLKTKINESLTIPEILTDDNMSKMTKILFEKLDKFRQKEFDQEMLSDVLKIQAFVVETRK